MANSHSNGNGSGGNGSGRAVLYLRMSSAKQDKSIPAQRDELHAYAEQHGYEIVDEYADSAISGDATEKRDAFLRLREDASSGRFDVVLAWDQDRLSRNDPLELGYWLKPIRDAGVRLETVVGGRVDWDSFAGRVVYLIQQEAKHAYLRDLSQNVTRGLIAASNNGRKGTGGRSPQGLDGNPDRAAIIRRIFDEYLRAGSSLRSVANTLNREGVPTPRGAKWSNQTIGYILRNEKYTGAFVRFKYRAGRYNSIEDGKIVPRTKSDRLEESGSPVVVPDHHEGIVDRETFDRAQAKLASGQRDTAKRVTRRYVLSGLLRCSDCGGAMAGTPRHGRKTYRCRSYSDGGRAACHANSVFEDDILRLVVRKLLDGYASEKALDRLRSKIEDVQQRDRQRRGSRSSERSRTEKRIEAIDKQIDQGTERVLTAPDHVVERLYKRLDELKAERDRLVAALRDAQTPRDADPQADAKEVEAAIEALRRLREAVEEADPEELRDLLRGTIDRIELDFDHVQLAKREKNTLSGGKIYVRPDKGVASVMTAIPGFSWHDPRARPKRRPVPAPAR